MRGTKGNPALAAAEAEQIWRLYGFASPRDLVLEDLAYAMGVLVVDGPLDSAEARLVRSGRRGLIRIRDGISNVGRRRFTIAHELGHWVLHEKHSQVVACTNKDLLVAYHASPEESDANVFGSTLLMPRDLFDERARGREILWGTVRELAHYFGTSLTATAVRLIDLTADYGALVVSENGRITWWKVSAPFRDAFRVQARSKVPPGSVAATLFEGGTHPGEPIEQSLDRWSHVDGAEGEVMEDTLFLDHYGVALSLVSLL